MSKTASLTSGLVTKKGEAAPAAASAVAEQPKSQVEQKSKAQSSIEYYKALTVKLDRNRYETLKNVGVKMDKKSQDIFVEALDLWLKQATPELA